MTDGGHPGRQAALTRSAEQKAGVSATCGCASGQGCAREACRAPVTVRDPPAPHSQRPPRGRGALWEGRGQQVTQESRTPCRPSGAGAALHLPQLGAGLMLAPHMAQERKETWRSLDSGDQGDVAPPPVSLDAEEAELPSQCRSAQPGGPAPRDRCGQWGSLHTQDWKPARICPAALGHTSSDRHQQCGDERQPPVCEGHRSLPV